MKKIVLLTLSALMLTACGGNGNANIVKSCMSEGESKATCTCLADAIEDGADEETFKIISKAAKDGGMDDAIAALPKGKEMSVAMIIIGAAAKCSK